MASLTHAPDRNASSNHSSGFMLQSSFSPSPAAADMVPFWPLFPLKTSTFSWFSNSTLSELEGLSLPFTKHQQEFSPVDWEDNGISNLDTALPISDNPVKINGIFSGLDKTIISAINADGNLSLRRAEKFKVSPHLLSSSVPSGGKSELRPERHLISSLPSSNNPPIRFLPSGTSEAGPSLRGVIGGMGINVPPNGFSALLCSSSPTSPLGSTVETLLCPESNWDSMNAIDLCREGLEAVSDSFQNFTSDPGFAERAAKFSCFNGQTSFELVPRFLFNEEGKGHSRSGIRSTHKRTLSPLSSFPRIRNSALQIPSQRNTAATQPRVLSDTVENCTYKRGGTASKEYSACLKKVPGGASCSLYGNEFEAKAQKRGAYMNNSDEEDGSSDQGKSSISDQGVCSVESIRQKRTTSVNCADTSPVPATTPGNKDSKSTISDERKAKRQRSAKYLEKTPKVEQSSVGKSEDSTVKAVKEHPKPPEVPKPSYVHIRARRGQATDSHSLAERVRREKISERMKLLQELVPGCSKVIGKAGMLDEIINYVQSLQRQVECLSMKLAALSQIPDINLHGIINKEMLQPGAGESTFVFAQENPDTYPAPVYQPPQRPPQVSCELDVHPTRSPMDPALTSTINTQMASMEALGNALVQISQSWDDELQNAVQMDFGEDTGGPWDLNYDLVTQASEILRKQLSRNCKPCLYRTSDANKGAA